MKSREAFVAIVGEPNVGKSSILNRLISERAALTSDVAGTTRDRFYASTSWNGIDFTLIDTAGIILEQRDELEKNVQKQVEIAISECDLVLYVLDGKKNPESINRVIMKKLRGLKKDLLVVINKIDSPRKHLTAAGEYAFTGFKKIYPISAISGLGIGDLLDAVAEHLNKQGFSKIEKDPSEIAVSIVGKPNVGKSSLFNTIIGEERVVVSNVPGTTRNTIDTDILYKDQKIKLLDTAGLKKKEKRAPLPDIYAAFQTLRALHKSDVAIFMIDSSLGITQQDQHIAAEIIDAAKGLVVAVNKTDLLKQDERKNLEKHLPDIFPFLWWAPIVPISAKKNQGVTDLLNYVLEIQKNRRKEIPNQQLSEFFYEKLKQRQPQRIRDERIPKVYSLHQIKSDPPVFEMIVNEPSAISMQFRKFIENSIIKELGFWGTPVLLKLRRKSGNPNVAAIE